VSQKEIKNLNEDIFCFLSRVLNAFILSRNESTRNAGTKPQLLKSVMSNALQSWLAFMSMIAPNNYLKNHGQQNTKNISLPKNADMQILY